MKKILAAKIQRSAYGIVFWQWIGLIMISSLAAIIHPPTGLGLLLGGSCYALPNILFVWRVFRYQGAQEMPQFLAAFILWEVLKIIMCGFLFLVIVKTGVVSLSSVLIGLVIAIFAFWLSCLALFSK